MIDGDQLGSGVLTLLVVFSTVGVGTTAVAGIAAAQSGSVDLQDRIPEDSKEFDVEIPELEVDGQGCVIVENEDNEDIGTSSEVSENDTVTVTTEEVGGIERGDDITATLYQEFNPDFQCEGRLDNDTTTVTEAAFTVDIVSTNEPVTENDTLNVTTTVENTGAQSDIQDIVLLIDGEEKDTQGVALEGNSSLTVTLSWETGPGDAGEHFATVASEDDMANTSVTVNEPANFAVSIDSTNEPVTENDTLDVTATVENTDDIPDTQDVVLRIDGTQTDSTAVSLDGGESQTVTLSWATQPGDAGDYNATVASETDMANTSVTVNEPANLTVAIDATNEPVVENDTLEVTATVENTGDELGTQDVVLRIDGTQTDSTAVSLDGGESQTVTLTWQTGAGDAGVHTATVASEDDAANTSVTVNESAHFAVAIDATNGPVNEGTPLDVTATITNTGDASDTQDILLDVDGDLEDSTTLTLDGGASETVTLTWQTGSNDAGVHTATVASEDDAANTSVTVDEPGNGAGGPDATFEVTIDDVAVPDAEGGSLDVTATVENTGSETDTQTVTLTVDGVERDSRELTLDGGESQTVTFSWEEPDDVQESNLEVSSEDDFDVSSIQVDGDGGPFAFDLGELVSPESAVSLLFLLLALLLVYYYYRRRRQQE